METRIPQIKLPQRAAQVTQQAGRAVSSGRFPLDPALQNSVVWELTEILRLLQRPAEGLGQPIQSVFPATWLQSRWDSMLRCMEPWPEELWKDDLGSWFPYVRSDVTQSSATRGIDYARALGFVVDPFELHPQQPPPVSAGWVAAYSLYTSLGRPLPPELQPDSPGLQEAREYVVRVSGRPDPTLNFEFVRAARCARLFQACQREFKAVYDEYRQTTNRDVELWNRVGPKLLVQDDQWRLSIAVTFQTAGTGTMVHLGSVQGVHAAAAVQLLAIQRLCLVLLGLVYGPALGRMDPAQIPWAEAEQGLRDRGISDQSGPEAGQKWQHFTRALEANITRRRGTSRTALERNDATVYEVRGGFLGFGGCVVVTKECFSRADMSGFIPLLISLQKRDPTLVFGESDSSALRELQREMRRRKLNAEIVLAGSGVVWDSSSPGEASASEITKLVPAAGFPEPTQAFDLIAEAAPRLSVLDPAASLCWLAVMCLSALT